VENQGDGTVMQQSEVQEVTFSAGMGVGGAATLTYTDLYGQSWTTRPINLGGGSHYVLDYALGSGHALGNAYLVLQYGSDATSNQVATGVNTLGGLTAPVIRSKLLTLPNIYNLAAPTTAKRANLAKNIRVVQRKDQTSHKFQNGIQASTKKTFDIYITPDVVSGVNENGGLLEFKAYLATGASSKTENATEISEGNAYVNVASGFDASADIKDALEGLPNSVIPAVTVSKVDATSANTDDLGTNGNAYHKTYAITFSSASNSGDQNMLSCDATSCDHDGCANRKVGVASVHYLHADFTTAHATTGEDSTAKTPKTARINFEGQGYFIMDIHRDRQDDATALDFSAGNAYVEWNTGSGVERAEFAIIATAATVQTALRGITGWSGVTVTSSCQAATLGCDAAKLTKAHSYTVKFPSGYDDGGQTPNVGLVDGFGGNGADDGVAIIYDQRFSNSLWLGDITGYQLVACTVSGDVGPDFCNVGTKDEDTTLQLESGDNMIISIVQMGHKDASNGFSGSAVGTGGTNGKYNSFTNLAITDSDIGLPIGFLGSWAAAKEAYVKIDHSADLPTQTSQNTEHYFAVGSEIEVLDTTWDNSALATDTTAVPNQYRSFKVLSHVKNTHGHTFAKLDSTPTTDTSTNYALKVTTHNSTVTRRKNIDVNGAQNEIQQILALQASGAKPLIDDADTFRIYINANKANVEFTEVLSGVSTPVEIAEAINAFAALSGPVTVTKDSGVTARWEVTFAAIDGDVPQLSIVEHNDATTGTNAAQSDSTAAANTYAVSTLVDGWSFFAGSLARLENVQPGSVINVTSSEVVTFSISDWTVGNLVFAYDGTVAGAPHTFANRADAAKVVEAISSIKDAKGAAKITVTCGTALVTSIVVTMPEGADGSKLELVPTSATDTAGFLPALVTKSVAKNNNGRSFKVVRVEQQEFPLGDPKAGGDESKTSLTYETASKAALTVGDEVTISRTAAATPCQYLETADDKSIVDRQSKLISAVDYAAAPTVVYTFPTFHGKANVGCTFSAYRTVLVVDSMPDTMSAASTGGNIEMDIYGPKGSCSVSETVKGTYESDVCSSRGSCDGAAGLCTCHEGYSGEACETQTVLV
jgi:hypothetical protein